MKIRVPNNRRNPGSLTRSRRRTAATTSTRCGTCPTWNMSASGPACTSATRAPRGLHHLVYEVVDNSIDEAMAGYATEIRVTVNADGSVTVQDDGRGIPVANDESIGKSALEGVMTMLKYGGKFDKQAYKTSGGLHGIGVKAVNFLSEWCEVEVRRDGHVYQQEYERGKPTGEVDAIGTPKTTGTKITFKPDPAGLRRTQVRLQHPPPTPAGTRVPQRGVQDQSSTMSGTTKARRSSTTGADRVRRVPQPCERRRPAGSDSHQRTRPRASASRSPCSTPTSTPKTSTPTSTTSTRSKAERISPASARP